MPWEPPRELHLWEIMELDFPAICELGMLDGVRAELARGVDVNSRCRAAKCQIFYTDKNF